MKTCSKCKIEKSFDCFLFRKDNNKLRNDCKECQAIISKIYRNKNKEYLSKYKSEDRKKKIIHYRNYIRNYVYERRKKDSLFKFTTNVRALIRVSIKGKGYKKTSKTFEILGCTFEEFRNYIESKFIEGMNWDNHGEWHLDHIIPIASAETEEEIIKLNHYTNFQPLWAEENLRKGARLDY